MTTNAENEFYARQGAQFGVFDRARYALLRRAVVDENLTARDKLVLFTIAERCDQFSYGVTLPTAELERLTGMKTLAVAGAVCRLRLYQYLENRPGKTYTLLIMRVVSNGEA